MMGSRRAGAAGHRKNHSHRARSRGRLLFGDSNLLPTGGEPPSNAPQCRRHHTASMPGVSEYNTRKGNQDRGPFTPFQTPDSRPCPGIEPSQPIPGFKPGQIQQGAIMASKSAARRKGEAASILSELEDHAWSEHRTVIVLGLVSKAVWWKPGPLAFGILAAHDVDQAWAALALLERTREIGAA